MAFQLHRTALYAESWNVAFRRTPQGGILTDRDTPFCVIPNAMRYWAADPMVFSHGGDTFIFAELYDYVLRRGGFGVSRFLNNGTFGPWQPILQEPFHLSYPYVFRSGDEIFMVPESTQRKALLVYRAVEFPLRWELHKVIREDVQWADTSVVPVKDGFAAMTQSYEQEAPCTLSVRLDRELNITEWVRLQGRVWTVARPGGRPFCHRDAVWHIFQDCREDYGKALYFCAEDGQEVYLKPDDLRFDRNMVLDGMHTYSATEGFEVIDFKTRRLNLLNLLFRLIGKSGL